MKTWALDCLMIKLHSVIYMNKNLIEYGGKIVVVTSTSVYKLISVYQLIYDKLLLRMLHC